MIIIKFYIRVCSCHYVESGVHLEINLLLLQILAFGALLTTAKAIYYPAPHPAVSSQSIVHHDEGLGLGHHDEGLALGHHDEGLALGHIAAPAHYAVPLVQAAPLAHYAAPAIYADYDVHGVGHEDFVSKTLILIDLPRHLTVYSPP